MPPREVVAYYDRFAEETRLATGPSRLEFERTKEILARLLPKPPARVLDVGGAAGAYSVWLAAKGYDVHLVDASARLVEAARTLNATLARPIASLTVADARSLPQADRFAHVVLLMGPLYHLSDAIDRRAALREADRVLAPSGTIVVAAISRYASTLDGLARNLTADPAFVRIRDRDLRNGRHRNDTDRPDYFTTAYFHRPEELQRELEDAGFAAVRVLGVEGPGWMIADFDSRWAERRARADLVAIARALEEEPSIRGASAHLLGAGRKPRWKPKELTRTPMSKKPAATHPNADAFPPGIGGPALRALANAGIRSMSDLSRRSEAELAALHGMGPKALSILKSALAASGGRLRKA
ncbi:MAG TPA: methyltransferase domain-containing protein [Vicinamibacterales bacterium]